MSPTCAGYGFTEYFLLTAALVRGACRGPQGPRGLARNDLPKGPTTLEIENLSKLEGLH